MPMRANTSMKVAASTGRKEMSILMASSEWRIASSEWRMANGE
jgi:hypothetical protein